MAVSFGIPVTIYPITYIYIYIIYILGDAVVVPFGKCLKYSYSNRTNRVIYTCWVTFLEEGIILN